MRGVTLFGAIEMAVSYCRCASVHWFCRSYALRSAITGSTAVGSSSCARCRLDFACGNNPALSCRIPRFVYWEKIASCFDLVLDLFDPRIHRDRKQSDGRIGISDVVNNESFHTVAGLVLLVGLLYSEVILKCHNQFVLWRRGPNDHRQQRQHP